MTETGAAHGRAGGRIGSGVRLRKKLASAPRMTVLAVVDKSSTAKRKRTELEPEAVPSATALTQAHVVASKAAGEAFADMAGVSPPTKKLIVAAALAGAAASHAVQPHVPAAAPLKGGKAKMPPRACSPLPPIEGQEPNVAETSTAPAPKSSMALTLKALPRGTRVVVQPAVKYVPYTWTDVVEIGTRVRSGEITMAQLSRKNEDGTWFYGIPRQTCINLKGSSTRRRASHTRSCCIV